MCEGRRLDVFRVCFDLDKFARHDIDKWLYFAFSRNVQRLELNLLESEDSDRDLDSFYTFPDQLLGLNVCPDISLSQFHSNNFLTLPLVRQNFNSVKVLILKWVNVSGEVLEFFLHNCPFLEEMTVLGSGTLVNLDVVGPSLKLKHLDIWYCYNLESLKVCDNNLITFSSQDGTAVLFKNVPRLVEVSIKYVEQRRFLLKIMSSHLSCLFSQLEFLTLYECIQLELRDYRFPELPSLKKFTLVMDSWRDRSLLGYTPIIKAAPLLKEFELQEVAETDVLKRSNRECRKVPGCLLHHLKVVTFYGYFSRIGELEMVKFFLENAVALEKIVIDVRRTSRKTSTCSPSMKHKDQQNARDHAKQQLEGVVPSDIALVIL